MASLKDTALETRRKALDRGDALQAQGDELQNKAGFDSDYYSDKMKDYGAQADASYADLAANPGYTEEEAGKLAPDYSRYRTSEADLEKRGLTDAEQGAIMGDPNAAFQYYDPSRTREIQQGSQGQQNDATRDLQDRLDAASASGAADSAHALDTEGNSMVSAFGDEKTGLEGAVDRSKLGLSSDFSQNYKMTPEQQQDIETAAGTTIGNRYRSAQSDLERAAAAQGNTSPMAIAAMREQLDRDSSADAGDAMTNARIAAANAAAQRLQTEEGMRLGSEQDISGRLQANAGKLGDTQMQAIEHYGDSSLSSAQAQQKAKMDAATTGGQAAIATADRTGQEAQEAEGDIQKTGQGLATAADATGATRAAGVAGNRQATVADVQNTGYSQGMQTGQATAQGEQTKADARRTDQKEGRGYLTTEQQQAQSGQQTSRGQEIGAYGSTTGAYGTEMGAANQATGAATAANAQPGTFEKVTGAVTGAAAAFLEDGTPPVTGGLDTSTWDTNFDEANAKPWDIKPEGKPSFWDKLKRYRQDAQPQEQQQQQRDPYSWSTIGSNVGKIARAVFAEDGGTASGQPSIVGEQGPEYVGNLERGGGSLVTRPTMGMMEHGDVVVPFNRTPETKVPASLNRLAVPMEDGGINAAPGRPIGAQAPLPYRGAASGSGTPGPRPIPPQAPLEYRGPGSTASTIRPVGSQQPEEYRGPNSAPARYRPPAGAQRPNQPLHALPAYR